jgi:hypothetical protein
MSKITFVNVLFPISSDPHALFRPLESIAKIRIIFETTKKSGKKFHLSVMEYLPGYMK